MKRKRIAVWLVLTTILFIALLCLPLRASASKSDGLVEFIVFNSPECGSCEFFTNELWPRLQREYGPKIRYEYYDVTEFDNIRKMVNIESAYGRFEMDMPQVYIDGIALIGSEEVEERFEELINEFAAKGGVDMPAIPNEDGGDELPPTEAPPIYLTYFYNEGCRECDPISIQLDYLRGYDSQVITREYDLMTTRGLEMNEAMCTYTGVPEDDRAIVPALFVGSEYLVGEDLSSKSIQEAIERARSTGTEYLWKDVEDMIERARTGVSDRFNSFTFLTVMGAGLLDGINPCAFTVIVFFISYLAFIGRRGRDMLYTGIAFAAAVLVTYFLIGLGLLSFVRYLGTAGRWVTLGVAILTVLFGIVCLYDYLRGRKKGEAQSTLGLPRNVTRRIHEAIREKTKTRHFIAAAVVLGVIIASLELGCTGQVYLPTITFVARAGGDRLKAVLYLAAYNLMFIVPLLVVFALAYAGTGSDKIVEFGRKRANGLKLAMAIVLFALAALLFVTL